MTESTALSLAQKIWGSKAFVRVNRQHTPDDDRRANEECQRTHQRVYVVNTGPITGYTVGYYRTGKRGARLSTWTTGETFEAAFSQWCGRSKKASAVLGAS